MLKVLGIGDNVCDKYVHSGIMYPGGQALNFSVYAKMLGADSSYMGIFGRDEVADHVIKTLKVQGVEFDHCRQYKGENGYAKVGLVEGDRIFLGSNKGGIAGEKPLKLAEEDILYIAGFDLVHTSNNSHFNGQLPIVYETGVPISYDFSCQWVDEELIEEVAPYATFAFLSCGTVSEGEVRDICHRMKEKGCGLITATRGGKGALLFDGTEFYEQKPKLVEAVDTLGAGDSYAAAFLISYMEKQKGRPDKMKMRDNHYKAAVREAMEKGAAFAAQTCLMRGAFGHGIAYTEGRTDEVMV